MKQWYYADDARNRIGPVYGDELREHYRQRRLRRDSLVWSEGMVQWMPLDAVAPELDLASVTPDASMPPPMPPAMPARAPGPVAAPPRKGMSGCLIAVIVCAALAVPMIAILAAIALPAYNDYVQRAKVMGVVTAVAPLEHAIDAHAAREASCPDGDSADLAPLLSQLAAHPHIGGLEIGVVGDDRCAFEVRLRGLNARHDGNTLLFASGGEGRAWTCDGGDLPDKLRPRHCRSHPNDFPN